MCANSIPELSSDDDRHVQSILKQLVSHYTKETKLLIAECYRRGWTYQEVADLWGVSRQAVAARFPKKQLLNK